MKWKKIDPKNLPTVDQEVVAINDDNDAFTGILMLSRSFDVVCQDVNGDEWKCTHYILLSDLLNLEKE